MRTAPGRLAFQLVHQIRVRDGFAERRDKGFAGQAEAVGLAVVRSAQDHKGPSRYTQGSARHTRRGRMPRRRTGSRAARQCPSRESSA